MTIQQLCYAINKTASNLGLKSWIEVNDPCFIPQALNNLSALIFQMDYPENELTDLVKEQSKNLIFSGRLIFEE